MAKAILLSLALRHLGINESDLLAGVLGQNALRLTSELTDVLAAQRAPSMLAESARALIARHKGDVNVKTLSAELHLHRNALSRDFRMAFGMSIPYYLRIRRILIADELARTTSLSKKAIAQSVGCGYSTLCRQFTRVLSKRPTARHRR